MASPLASVAGRFPKFIQNTAQIDTAKKTVLEKTRSGIISRALFAEHKALLIRQSQTLFSAGMT